jgi:hypothetical protein
LLPPLPLEVCVFEHRAVTIEQANDLTTLGV